MKKKYGMSSIGYAIVTVILVGVLMIISAPMIIDTYKTDNKNSGEISKLPKPNDTNNSENNDLNNNEKYMIDLAQKIRNLEDQMNVRISALEQKNNNVSPPNTNNTVSDRYVCSIEGTLSESGDVIPLSQNDNSNIETKKIVFVCEYRK